MPFANYHDMVKAFASYRAKTRSGIQPGDSSVEFARRGLAGLELVSHMPATALTVSQECFLVEVLYKAVDDVDELRKKKLVCVGRIQQVRIEMRIASF